MRSCGFVVWGGTMKLKCECGWEGNMSDAAIVFRYNRITIDCPVCKQGVSIGVIRDVKTEIVVGIHAADGWSLPLEAQ